MENECQIIEINAESGVAELSLSIAPRNTIVITYEDVDADNSNPASIPQVVLQGDVSGSGNTGATPINVTLQELLTDEQSGEFGGVNKRLTVTVDRKGRVTAISEQVFPDIHVGTEPPTDTNMLWLDTN